MSTITLYASKINQMPELLKTSKQKISDFKDELQKLNKKILKVDNSACDVYNEAKIIQASVKIQEGIVDSIGRFQEDLDGFISDTVDIDNNAASLINANKNEFYKKYSYLKPECEKSIWEKVKDGFKKVWEWCQNIWNAISDIDLFNELGKLIHSEWFCSIVSTVTGWFYQVGGYKLIKFLTKKGTQLAIFAREHKLISAFIPGMNFFSSLVPNLLSITLNADMDSKGIYHIRPDCWQQKTQYSTGYDDVFRAAINEASGGKITVDVHQSQIFWVDINGNGFKEIGEEFIIWSWKGDYINLGAGAETGIYQVIDGERDVLGNYEMMDGEYSYIYAEVNRDYSVSMSLELYYDENHDGIYTDDEKLYNYSPTEAQWWITGFDPLVQNVKSDELKAVTVIDFSSYGENAKLFYDSFREANSGNSEWIFPDDSYKVILNW